MRWPRKVSHPALAQWKEGLSPRWLRAVQHCFICRPSDSTVSEDAGLRADSQPVLTPCKLSLLADSVQNSHSALAQLKQSQSPTRVAICLTIFTFTKVWLFSKKVILANLKFTPDQCFERSNNLHPRFIVRRRHVWTRGQERANTRGSQQGKEVRSFLFLRSEALGEKNLEEAAL